MQRRTACLILLLLFSMGCRVGPRYDPPCPPVPQNWKNPTHENAFLSDVGCWWEVFDDGRLNALEIQAVMNNPTIHLALARIEEAWALAGIRRADLFPQLNIQPSFTNTGQLFELFLPQGTQVTIPSPIFRVHLLQYALPLNLSYEVDLWGKYRSQYESAYQNAQAEEEAYRATILSLTAELASTYFNLRAYDTLANILQRTLENRQSDYNLIKSRFEKGLVNYLDVSNASLEVSNTESDYDDALKQRGIQENMIATLVGTPASELRLEPMPLLEAPPFIPAGIPSTVLLRRPDIAQAERTMASDNSQIRAAYADFFPSLSLTGTLGFLSPDVRQFLRWISRYWALGASSNQTVFDGFRKCSTLQDAIARFKEASWNYQQVVLTAFKEVEDALNNLEYEAKQADSLQRSLVAANDTVRLSTNRYKKGLTNYIDVVNNQRSQLNAERNYITILSLQYQSTIQLIKALGGSWGKVDSLDETK